MKMPEDTSHNGLGGFVSARQVKHDTVLKMPQSEKELWDRQRRQHTEFWAKLKEDKR